MSINFRASPSGHFKLLDESLKLFDDKSQHFKLRSSSGHSLNIPMRFKMLSTFLSDIFDSFAVIGTGVKTIILPDCNHVHAKNLLDLLTEGHTRSKCRQEDIQFVKDGIIDVAEILGIDIKNLAYDEQKEKELEDGEIIDDYNESRSELSQEVVNIAKVKIASFAAADIFSPNIVTHDLANNNSPQYAEAHFKCDICNYVEKTQFKLIKHMKICHNWTCPVCGRVSVNLRGLKEHMGVHNHYKCSLCNYAGFNEEKFNKHKLTHSHSSEKFFKCELCHYAGSKRGKLNRHWKKNHT